MARKVQRGDGVPLDPAYDMWQFGMLVYQLASQPWPYEHEYWDTPAPAAPPHAPAAAPPPESDEDVLSRLAAYASSSNGAAVNGAAHGGGGARVLLPHEAAPLRNETLRYIVDQLLAPSAAARWSSEQLRVHLELNTTSLTMRGQAPAGGQAPTYG
jgi:hypothetical protein